MITANSYPPLNVFVIQLEGQVKAREILRDLTAVLNSGDYPAGANVIIDLRNLAHSLPCANFDTLAMLVASNAHLQNVKQAILMDGELNTAFDTLQAAQPSTSSMLTRHFYDIGEIARWLEVESDPLVHAMGSMQAPGQTLHR